MEGLKKSLLDMELPAEEELLKMSSNSLKIENCFSQFKIDGFIFG